MKTKVRATLSIDPWWDNSAWDCVFGAENGRWYDRFALYTQSDGWKTGCWGQGSFNLTNSDVRAEIHYGRKVVYELDAITGKLTIYAEDGTTVLNETQGNPKTADTNISLYIFADHFPNSQENYHHRMNLYGFEIYEEGELVHDFVPYVQNGVSGIYDTEGELGFKPVVNVSGDPMVAGTITAYEGKIVCFKYNNHAYKYEGGIWVDYGAMTMEEISDTNYKDLNNWVTNDDHVSVFEGKINYVDGVNDIPSYSGTSGWEPLLYKLENLEVGADYNFSFKYTDVNGATKHSGKDFRAAVWNQYDLSTNEDFNTYDPNHLLPLSIVTDMPATMDFTASQDWMSLIIQFGALSDNTSFAFKFSDLKVQKYVYPIHYPEIVTISSKATDGEKYYGTLYYSDKNLQVPTGITANAATVSNNVVTLKSVGDVIKAGTAVVLEADAPGKYTFDVSNASGTTPAENMLLGTDEYQEIEAPSGYKLYILSLNAMWEENSIGFYYDKVEGDGSSDGTKVQNNAHKAYLQVPEDGAPAKGYPFGGDATGIDGLNANDNVNANEVFDLQGRKVNGKNLPKGIYVVDGKKVVIK